MSISAIMARLYAIFKEENSTVREIRTVDEKRLDQPMFIKKDGIYVKPKKRK